MYIYSVDINGIALKKLTNNLKQTEKSEDIYQYFSKVIAKNEKREEPVTIDLSFKEINGEMKLDSNPMNIAKLYLAFYIGETDFFSIKKVMQEFGEAL